MAYTLITGASSGIGEAFAKQLAAQKQNLILVARREERLQKLAGELKDAHGIEAQVVAADLASNAGVDALVAQVSEQGWALNGLINNAGFGDHGLFDELSLERQLNMIQLNVTSLVSLTYQLLPNLKQQSDSFIINVSSTAAFQGGPKMAVYYASKAFVLPFSEALHEELKGQVKVSALCPGATATEFADEAHVGDTLLFKAGTFTADKVASISLSKRHRAIVIPGLRYLLMIWLGKWSPRLVTRRIAARLQQ